MSKKPMKSTENNHGGKRPGTGRKPKYDEPTSVIAASLPESMAGRIRAEAEQRSVPISQVIIESVQIREKLQQHAIKTGQSLETVIDAAIEPKQGKFAKTPKTEATD